MEGPESFQRKASHMGMDVRKVDDRRIDVDLGDGVHGTYVLLENGKIFEESLADYASAVMDEGGLRKRLGSKLQQARDAAAQYFRGGGIAH